MAQSKHPLGTFKKRVLYQGTTSLLLPSIQPLNAKQCYEYMVLNGFERFDPT